MEGWRRPSHLYLLWKPFINTTVWASERDFPLSLTPDVPRVELSSLSRCKSASQRARSRAASPAMNPGEENSSLLFGSGPVCLHSTAGGAPHCLDKLPNTQPGRCPTTHPARCVCAIAAFSTFGGLTQFRASARQLSCRSFVSDGAFEASGGGAARPARLIIIFLSYYFEEEASRWPQNNKLFFSAAMF